ncbi:hypothetical protein [Dyella nitratireducens]|uniref:hypothetical protein n=1 Tax=Dyella nitratireducens TaxID=1849580 RepID=UPI0016638553|nr:hypothetical protein [Dyella nitratireducens]
MRDRVGFWLRHDAYESRRRCTEDDRASIRAIFSMYAHESFGLITRQIRNVSAKNNKPDQCQVLSAESGASSEVLVPGIRPRATVRPPGGYGVEVVPSGISPLLGMCLQCPAGTIDQLGNQYGLLAIHRHCTDRNGFPLRTVVRLELVVPINHAQLLALINSLTSQ